MDPTEILSALASRAMSRGTAAVLAEAGLEPTPEHGEKLAAMSDPYLDALTEEIEEAVEDAHVLCLSPIAIPGFIELAAARQGAALARAYLAQEKLAPNAPGSETPQ